VSGRLEQRLLALAEMKPPELKSEWLKVLKSEPPKLTPDLMRLAIAYRLQERQLGGMSAKVRRAIRSTEGGRARAVIKPGTRLLRSWNGRSIEVIVTDSGFEHDGRQFRSLSQIAREVTGTAWSGPRFFGLDAGA
jgi:hypothetical protein